jgi:hypothetical protein
MPSKFHSELDMVPWYWEPFNLFEGVSDFARDNFFRLTEKRKYAKGEYVFMANDLAKKIYLICQKMARKQFFGTVLRAIFLGLVVLVAVPLSQFMLR